MKISPFKLMVIGAASIAAPFLNAIAREADWIGAGAVVDVLPPGRSGDSRLEAPDWTTEGVAAAVGSGMETFAAKVVPTKPAPKPAPKPKPKPTPKPTPKPKKPISYPS